MDEQANALLAALKKPTTPIEAKLSLFNNLKSGIKHQRVPESAQPATIECIRIAITAQTSSSLVLTGFSALGHLIKRLALQDQLGSLLSARSNILGILLERLGDAKENHRSAAFQNLCDLWPGRPTDVEKAIKEIAIQGQNVRAKEMGMQWVAKMHNEQGLQFRSFVAPMVACLEDADGTVRESAKTNLVELFRTARDSAKADLKRQLIAYNVRKSITTYILSQLEVPVPAELSLAAPSHAGSRSEYSSHEPHHVESTPPEPVLPPSAQVDYIEPLYIYSSRELEDTFRQMQPCFEDRETEDNWKARDKNVLKIRRLVKGNAPHDHRIVFINGIKNLLDGILKVANSLRTTMSSSGCQLVQELARELGPGLDAMAEIILHGFEKMCAATKHISAENGNTTIETIISHVSYSIRLLQFVWSSCQDKNVQPRTFAAGWLKTILVKQAHNRHQLEVTGGLELADKCIRKGLADANPKARESWRSTYWLYARQWPEKASAIMDNLDAKSQSLLQKHPDNPDPKAAATSFSSSVGPGSTAASRAAAASSRASLKEQIAKQKASVAARWIPDRPNSAMSTFSPIKEAPQSARRGLPSQLQPTNPRVASVTTSSTTSRPTAAASASTGQGSLMSAPMRRPRRPEAARPATADPYAEQRLLRPATPSQSPTTSTPRVALKSSLSNLGSSHVKSHSTTSSMIPTAIGSPQSSRGASPRTTPMKARQRSIHAMTSPTTSPKGGFSPIYQEENMTMVVPPTRVHEQSVRPVHKPEDEREQPSSSYAPAASVVDVDQFTTAGPSSPDGPDDAVETQPTEHDHKELTSPASPPLPASDNAEPETMETEEDRVEDTKDAPSMTPPPHEHSATEVPEQSSNLLMVYEDPGEDDARSVAVEDDEKPVLEELPINKQNLAAVADGADAQHQEAVSNADERPVSPSKKSAGTVPESSTQDQADMVRHRRLLASGTDRVRQRRLDAHGFRRLQELVKNNAEGSGLNFAELLAALLEFVEAPNDSLQVSAVKAHGLKSQALSTARAIMLQGQANEAIRQQYPRALCAIVSARKEHDKSSHVATDLERTAHEVIRLAGEQADVCTDAVLTLAEREKKTVGPAHRRSITMALNILSKLLAGASYAPTEAQHARMGALAVRFLADIDPDVRRADTEFCIELHATFGKGEQEQAGFWRCLKGAGDSQLNLVAYYLARRAKA